jgi:hypothetical protein
MSCRTDDPDHLPQSNRNSGVLILSARDTAYGAARAHREKLQEHDSLVNITHRYLAFQYSPPPGSLGADPYGLSPVPG